MNVYTHLAKESETRAYATRHDSRLGQPGYADSVVGGIYIYRYIDIDIYICTRTSPKKRKWARMLRGVTPVSGSPATRTA